MSQVLRLSVLASALLPLMTTAQTEKSPTNNNHLTNSHHDVMTVYATGNERDSFNTPMMVTVIKNDSPETKTANNANDILRKVPGIALTGTSRTNGQDISMRGFDRRGILTLVDGVRQGTDTGHINGTFLDPALIKQVEIIRGPSALLYGSGAMGGVIAWETVNAKDLLREGQNQGFRVFTQGATGDHSFGFGGSAFGKTDDFDGLFSFVTKESGDVRLGGGEKMDNKETIANMLGKGTWQLDDAQTLSGQIRYYNNDAYEPKDPQQLATSKDNKQVNRTTRQRDLQATYQLNPDDNSWLNLKATPYYSDVNITSKGKESNYEGRSQKTYGIKLDNRSDIYELPLAAHNFTYGTEAYRQKQTPYAGTTQFPDAEITFAAGFIQDEITLKDLPVSFILGTRYDNYKSTAKGNKDVKEDQWSSKAAVSITPTDWSMLFASYSEAFRAPTMMEMYNDSLHFKGGPISNYWRPNPDLKPESTRTAEYGFGLRFDDLLMARDNLRFKASYFDTKAKDYINTYVNTDRVNWNNNYTTSINTKRAKIWGTDVSLDYTTDYFAWGLAYNHTVGVNEYTGKAIESIKPDSLTSNLSVPIADSGFSVGWLGEFTTHTDFDKTSKLKQQPGYAVHDFYLNYQGDGSLKGLGTSVVLGNAFDKEYYSSQGIPQDGRNAKLLVSFQW
ncbi:TonB-dependent hemoglobin/transferrin/lactoferrin family receptor [Providencia sp. wls1914]|uniref:TonB-dependent hemoglobin/transferrin/lactoferrin family receptor n=1 Tax=Providencia sp. wls1914 TaxID=2675156 RepID=UPI0012B60DFE|nr:TonB-dependent hemoglobin/transferrin/lactoferrin family receptor [Providencia sp. wls1914]MTC69978.1 TonB-dependent hemoglobin/transferrin/lactoferrin family receptor [Providencia sp. wls1914]